MGVVVHAFNKRRCILDFDPMQSCNKHRILILQTAKLSMKYRCLEDGDMRLHNRLPRISILSTWLALR